MSRSCNARPLYGLAIRLVYLGHTMYGSSASFSVIEITNEETSQYFRDRCLLGCRRGGGARGSGRLVTSRLIRFES